MKASIFLACAMCVSGGWVFAGPRSSASYSILTDSIDPAGTRAQSANYAIDASAGGITGISSVASPLETMKHGYVGQLYDIVALRITAPPSENLNEGASRQLQAVPLADDETTLFTLNPSTVTWSILSGPIASISSAGLVTAAAVYEDTPAAIGGSAAGLTGEFDLAVLNVGVDDYQSYASDGIDDVWQVEYFGQPPNSNAGPTADPDGDGQNNRFEFTAGIIPTNPASRFSLTVANVPAQPGSKILIFKPRFADRNYTAEFRASLTAGVWGPLSGTTQTDSGEERTVTDLSATGAAKFYRIEISKP